MSEPDRVEWQRRVWGTASQYLGLAAVLGAMIAFFGIATERFFTLATFNAIANQIPDAVIVAVGMTFVLIIAGIDLSVGSVLALSGAVIGVCLFHGKLPLPVAIAAGLGVGLVCGAINGLVTIAWGIPSFIVTLGMLEMARGASRLVTHSRTLYLGPEIRAIATTKIAGLPAPFVVAILVVAAAQFVLARTVFGRYMVAIGTNEEAVRLSGIDPRRTKLAVFVLCGLLVSVAAVLYTARVGSAIPTAGMGFELRAIAAAVIGGTSLMGGRGSVVASFFGVLIIEVLDAGLIQLGAPDEAKPVIVGGAIIAAVIADHYRRRLARTGRGAFG